MASLIGEEFRKVQSAKLVGNFKVPKGYVRHDFHKISQALGQSVYTLSYATGSPRAVKGIGDVVENNVKRKFVPRVNAAALSTPRAFWHLYESNMVGQTSGRLFDIKIVNKGNVGSFTGDVIFKPSKSFVPLTELQTTPNPDTGRVVTSRHRFINKAMVYEYGLPITIRPKNAKYMVFEGSEGLVFYKKPIVRNMSKSLMTGSLGSVVSEYFGGIAEGSIQNDLEPQFKRAAKSAERAARVNLSISVASDSQAKAMAAVLADYIGKVI